VADGPARYTGICARCWLLPLNKQRRAVIALAFKNLFIDLMTGCGMSLKIARDCVSKTFPNDPEKLMEILQQPPLPFASGGFES